MLLLTDDTHYAQAITQECRLTNKLVVSISNAHLVTEQYNLRVLDKSKTNGLRDEIPLVKNIETPSSQIDFN